MSQDDRSPLPQGWTLNKEAIAQTKAFWAKRDGVSWSTDDAREAIHNMACFADILTDWATGGSAEADSAKRTCALPDVEASTDGMSVGKRGYGGSKKKASGTQATPAGSTGSRRSTPTPRKRRTPQERSSTARATTVAARSTITRDNDEME